MEWISVEDELPKYGKYVLLAEKEMQYVVEGQRKETNRFGELYYTAFGKTYCGCESEKITHWMPLPKPPKS